MNMEKSEHPQSSTSTTPTNLNEIRNNLKYERLRPRPRPRPDGGTGNPTFKSILKRHQAKTFQSPRVRLDERALPSSSSTLLSLSSQDNQNNKDDSIEAASVTPNPESTIELDGNIGNNEKVQSRSGLSSARLVIEATLKKSAGILQEFTENTISKNGSTFSSLLQPEKFGISTNLRKSRPWSDTTSSVSVSVGRKKPDMSKLPASIVQLLREDNSNLSINSSKNDIDKAIISPKKYHSKKMALRQVEDSSSSKIDIPVSRIKSSVSGDTKAPKIVIVSAPLQLESSFVPPPSKKESTIMEKMESKVDTKAPYRRLNHSPIIQSIKEAIDKVPHNSTKLSKDQSQCVMGKNETRVGTAVRKSQKVSLGVEKGVAFVLGPKTKHPYYNTFGVIGDIKDSKSLKDNSPSHCKWVINIGNFHDNEIYFSLLDNVLTITGFRQPSLKYPEGQMVSETISIPPGMNINNLRIYRSKNADQLLILEEVIPKVDMEEA